jgi:hypothetical protein
MQEKPLTLPSPLEGEERREENEENKKSWGFCDCGEGFVSKRG